jgi:integrase/recombinase XerD
VFQSEIGAFRLHLAAEGDAHDPQASDVDLWQREITVRGKGGKVRVVRITHDAARALDRYIRVRAGRAQARRRPLWLG